MILAVFVARFFSTAVFFPSADGDLAWQRWLGRTIRATARLPRTIGHETFTAPGAAWVPQEWLFSIIASLSNGPGWYALAAATAIAAASALYLCAVRATRVPAAPLAVAAVLAFAGITMLGSFGVRAQVFAWPLLASFLYLIECGSPVAYGAIAVAVIWSNVHASVMLAGPLALIAALGSFLDDGWSARTRRTLIVGFGSLLATCCTPLGIDLPRYAVALFSSPFKDMITEWKHTDIGDASFTFGALPLLLALAAFGIGGSCRWRDRCIVLTTAFLMFSATRNLPIFAIACFPIVVRSICASVPRFAKPAALPVTRADAYIARFMPAFSLILAVFVGYALVVQSRAQDVPSDDLQQALGVVRALPGTQNVFCADFAWCSFLIGTERTRIFLDGRADPYPQSVWDDFAAIVRVRPGWDRTLRARGTDVVVVGVTSPLEQALELGHDWRSRYHNDLYRIWTRLPPAADLRALAPASASRRRPQEGM